jgi:hypothetical protein
VHPTYASFWRLRGSPIGSKEKNAAQLPLPVDLQPRTAPANHRSPAASTPSQVRATPPGTCIRLCLRSSLAVVVTPLLLLASAQLGVVRLDALGVHTTTNLRASTMRFTPWRVPYAACHCLAVTDQERLPAIVLSLPTVEAPEEASRQLQVPL